MSPTLAFAVLTLAQQYPIVKDVYVNGQGPFRFLLDTGAQSNVLDPELARRLGLKGVQAVEVATVNGTLLAPLAPDVTITVDGKSSGPVEVIWYPLEAARRVDPGIEGVLGQAFLSRFRYVIDYKNKKLLLDPAAEPPGVKVPLHWIHGRPTLHAADGTRWVIDSGAPLPILFRGPAVAASGNGFVATSAAGSLAAGRDRLDSVVFGDLRLTRLSVAILPADGHEEDGLLPASLFRSVYLNPREGYAILTR